MDDEVFECPNDGKESLRDSFEFKDQMLFNLDSSNESHADNVEPAPTNFHGTKDVYIIPKVTRKPSEESNEITV